MFISSQNYRTESCCLGQCFWVLWANSIFNAACVFRPWRIKGQTANAFNQEAINCTDFLLAASVALNQVILPVRQWLMPAHRFYYCVSLLISACWMLGQVATGGSDKRYDQLRQSKDSFKKKIKWFAFLMSFLKNYYYYYYYFSWRKLARRIDAFDGNKDLVLTSRIVPRNLQSSTLNWSFFQSTMMLTRDQSQVGNT